MYIDRIDTSTLYRPFFNKVIDLTVACRVRGTSYIITSGFRSYQEQAALYAQGRTTPGSIVTNALPGQSLHNFGIAVDFCRDSDLVKIGLQPAWSKADYQILAEEAVKLGLEAGYNWKSFPDFPHCQLPIDSKMIKLITLDAEYKKNNNTSLVFQYLNNYAW